MINKLKKLLLIKGNKFKEEIKLLKSEIEYLNLKIDKLEQSNKHYRKLAKRLESEKQGLKLQLINLTRRK